MILAVVPAVVLLFMVYNADTREKEPLGLVLTVLALGAAVCLPVAVCENLADVMILSIFDEGTLSYLISSNLLGVALIEEAGKFLVMYLLVWKRREFDHVFDGVVYCVAAALGFALLENILYVCFSEDVIATAIGRALLSVPGHTCDGIFMGIFVGLAKKAKCDHQSAKCRTYLILCMLAPIAEHGIYDGILSAESDALMPFFYLFVLCVYVIAFFIVAMNRGAKDQPILVPGPQVTPMGGSKPYGTSMNSAGEAAKCPAASVQPQREDWYCSQCGAHMDHGKFCFNCGTPRL